MNKWPLALGLFAALLIGVAAGSIANPAPGALGPAPFDRQGSGGDIPGADTDPTDGERPRVTVPGLGVSVSVPILSGPSWLLAAILGLAILIGVAAIAVSGRSQDRAEQLTAVDEGEAATAVREAANRAADRIRTPGNAPVDNEVYRAWQEMTSHLDVDSPASTTPGEFAAAASDAGLPTEDVQTLQRLFERVRYGNEPVTDNRREAVAAALDSVAAAGEESDPADTSWEERDHE